jgi:hypothetical protein
VKFFITDETNIADDSPFKFFIYGGLVVDEQDMRSLCRKLLAIKRAHHIDENRPIKWVNKKWEGNPPLDTATHNQIKEEILNLIQTSDCKIIIYLSPQDFYHITTFAGFKIKRKIDHALHLTTQQYAVNVCLGKFNDYLMSVDKRGLIIADTFVDGFKRDMTAHCFSIFSSGTAFSRLERVIFPIVQVNNEYSQIHQLNDIVLGCIQYSLREISYNFLPIIKDNFWKGSGVSHMNMFGRGINIYPKKFKTVYIQKIVEETKEKFIRLIGI